MIEDKNLFIAICTKKERVIAHNDLKASWLRKGVFNASDSDLGWKTSDWIIQEIGLCIGRGMDIILLIEKGLRPPGGLQGNREYIEFERESPERSFKKVLEMIKAILPKIAEIETKPVEGKPPISEETNIKPEAMLASIEPSTAWNRDEYERALFRTVFTDDKEGEKRISEAFLSSPDGQKRENQVGWTAIHEYMKMVAGKGGNIEKLIELATESPQNPEAQWYLDLGYRDYEEYEKAAEAFFRSAEHSIDFKARLLRFYNAVVSFARAGKSEKLQIAIDEMKKTEGNKEQVELKILSAFREVAEINNDDDLYFGSTERLLELRPGENKARFQLAYQYSNKKREDLALFHYSKIPQEERDSTIWNNLGVAHAILKHDYNSVLAYRKSEELGGTLAMSNLANKFIDAGFLFEAEEICNRATKIENYDKEVGNAILKLKHVPDEEKDRIEKTIETSRLYADFYREFGRAAAKELPDSTVGGIWEGPQCKLTLILKDRQISANGNYDSPNFGLLALAFHTKGRMIDSATTRQFTIQYEGTVIGYSAKFQVITFETGKEPEKGLPAGSEKPRSGLMIISDSRDIIRVYEKDAPQGKQLYELRRIS